VIHPRVLEAPPTSLVSVAAARDHEVRLLVAVARPWEVMRAAARDDGVTLVAVSGFRDLARQTAIWEAKYRAFREEGLEPRAAVDRILNYSAPPGWSRHHWGTDLDLVGEALAEDPRLEAEDWLAGGPCEAAARWLEAHARDYGFVRPYDRPRGGFLAEPWHWSFAPLARPRFDEVIAFPWAAWLRGRPFAGATPLLEDLDRDLDRFLRGVAPEAITSAPAQ
jgi:LAS superfamily LD-carboxypeptidase LdcB